MGSFGGGLGGSSGGQQAGLPSSWMSSAGAAPQSQQQAPMGGGAGPYINPGDNRIGSNAYNPAQTQQSVQSYLGGLPQTWENVLKVAQGQTPLSAPLAADWQQRQRPSAIGGANPNFGGPPMGPSAVSGMEKWRLSAQGGPGSFGYNPEYARLAMTPIAQAYYASLPKQLPQTPSYRWGGANGQRYTGGGNDQYDVASERLPDPRLG